MLMVLLGEIIIAVIWFAHRRLSILDLSEVNQPFIDKNNNMIIYNGEIYNFRELREDLKKLQIWLYSDTSTYIYIMN